MIDLIFLIANASASAFRAFRPEIIFLGNTANATINAGMNIAGMGMT
jgi:hypothetical protein